MQLSKKQNPFCENFSAFLKCRSNLKQFEKKMTLIAYAFLTLPTAKEVVR